MPKPTRFRLLAGVLSAACLVFSAVPARAWVYPEHRDIAVLAVEKLDAERKAQFDRLWSEARTGNEQRLCAHGAESQQGVAPACIDWAALTGGGGEGWRAQASNGQVRSSQLQR